MLCLISLLRMSYIYELIASQAMALRFMQILLAKSFEVGGKKDFVI